MHFPLDTGASPTPSRRPPGMYCTLNVTPCISMGIGYFPRPEGLHCMVIKVNNVTVVTLCIFPWVATGASPSPPTRPPGIYKLLKLMSHF